MKFLSLILVASGLASPATAQGVNASVDALFDLLCGRTVHYYDPSGNQIEYTSGDGTAYLWFHGIPGVIVGTWGVYSDAELAERLADEGADGGVNSDDFLGGPSLNAQVCYDYPAGSFGVLDPGGLQCWTEARLFETVVQGGVFPGDRYGLSDGEPPYLLPEQPFEPLESFDADFPQLPPEPLCGLPIS